MLVRMKAEKTAQLQPCAGKTKVEPAQPGSPSDAGTLCPDRAGTARGTLHPEPVPCKRSTAALSSAHRLRSQARGQDIRPRSPFVLFYRPTLDAGHEQIVPKTKTNRILSPRV